MLVERSHPARSAFNGFKDSINISFAFERNAEYTFLDLPVIAVYNECIVLKDCLL